MLKNIKEEYNRIIYALKRYQESTNVKGWILGISGGKDSTVVGKLLCDAIGPNNVFGLIMPNHDKFYGDEEVRIASDVIKYLGISKHLTPIKNTYDNVISDIRGILRLHQYDVKGWQPDWDTNWPASIINVQPRLRMLYLYAVAQCLGYRVAGTGNLSERYTGWCTKWGDMACDFNPIEHLTCTEVIELGKYMNIPSEFINKVPADGLSGMTDEEKFGFTYEALDKYIRTGEVDDPIAKEMIDKRHEMSRHKIRPYNIFDFEKPLTQCWVTLT